MCFSLQKKIQQKTLCLTGTRKKHWTSQKPISNKKIMIYPRLVPSNIPGALDRDANYQSQSSAYLRLLTWNLYWLVKWICRENGSKWTFFFKESMSKFWNKQRPHCIAGCILNLSRSFLFFICSLKTWVSVYHCPNSWTIFSPTFS